MRFLIFLFLPLWAFSQNLKPGVYRDLKADKPLVLDTGNYTFINLQMKDLGKGVWLDGRKAKEIVLQKCSFEGKGKGTAIKTNGNTYVNHCNFKNMKVGILAEANVTRTLNITSNTFTDNTTAISLARFGPKGSATFNFSLKCNQFKLSCAEIGTLPTDPDMCDLEGGRMGLVIGEGVRVQAPNTLGPIPDQIGGTSNHDPNNALVAHPNANEWPLRVGVLRNYLPANTGDLQTVASWMQPSNWISLQNNPNNVLPPYNLGEVKYYRYKNEFVHIDAQESPGVMVTQYIETPANSLANPGLSSVTYDSPCENLGIDNFIIFPTRVAVIDSTGQLTGIETQSRNEAWIGDASPNPAQGESHFRLQVPKGEEMAILQFIEIGTSKVLSSKPIGERGMLDIQLDTRNLAAGIYLYQVVLKGKILGPKKLAILR